MPIPRRHFLIGAGAVAAGLAVGATPAHAEPVDVATTDAFQRAAERHGVPPTLLAAYAHAQTRWLDHAGRPSTSLGYGVMHLVDGAAANEARLRAGKDEVPASIDTLARAAQLTGTPADVLRTDPEANIDGGAALLADAQRSLGHPVGVDTDPAAWYQAVAAASGLGTGPAQVEMADTVMTTAASGARVAVQGGTLRTGAAKVGSFAAQRDALRAATAEPAARRGPRDRHEDALGIEWIPAPYESFGDGDYGNHDLAWRPDSPRITHIVIHDTECTYDVALKLVLDPTYVSWHYTLRSADGHIAQHVKHRDIGWHAGNWYINAHSIGLEHEGFMEQGATWYTEAMYRRSAALVRSLAWRYRIPLDRAHIIGHDQVPGVTTAHIRGMHVDPGPFWDWEHYFDLLGAPLDRGTRRETPRRDGPVDQVVRIVPRFDTNTPEVSGKNAPANFVYVYSAPSLDAPLVRDPGQRPDGSPATTDAYDVSARASAGADYVAIERRGDWLSIWFCGQQGWILDPRSSPRTRVVPNAKVARAKRGVTAQTFGRAYPEAEAYPPQIPVQAISPLVYTFSGDQAYVVRDASVPTDYYRSATFDTFAPDDHVNVEGEDRYAQIHFGQRVVFVRQADVDMGPVRRRR